MVSRLMCSFLLSTSCKQGHLRKPEGGRLRMGFALISLLIAGSFVVEVSAQSGVSTGSILGFVTDMSGAVVPGAEVVITNDTGYKRIVISKDDGSYRALLLPPGNYEVSASRSGFKTFVRKR